MFTFDQIKEFIELVGRNRLHGLEIERAGFKLRITGEMPAPPSREIVVTSPVAAGAQPASSPTVAPQPAPEAGDKKEERAAASGTPSAGLHIVTSPIVGTFYSAPSPDSEPYVRVGDRARKGQVLCIVEAMKLMNEIESDVAGVIAEIYPKNAQPVEFGEPLFGLRPD